MKFSPKEKVKLVEELASESNLVERLRELGIASSTYYGWKRRLAARRPPRRRSPTRRQLAGGIWKSARGSP